MDVPSSNSGSVKASAYKEGSFAICERSVFWRKSGHQHVFYTSLYIHWELLIEKDGVCWCEIHGLKAGYCAKQKIKLVKCV